jgi:hypothetical protein
VKEEKKAQHGSAVRQTFSHLEPFKSKSITDIVKEYEKDNIVSPKHSL